MSWETYANARERHLRKWMALAGTGLLFVLLLSHYSCTSTGNRPVTTADLQGEPSIRVKLTAASGKSQASVSVSGQYEVFAHSPATGRGLQIAEGSGLEDGLLRVRGDGLEIGGSLLGSDWVELAPAQDGALSIGKRSYRGSLLIGVVDGKLLLINKVLMEQYLAGVLGAEMPLDWGESALVAQAIAARTYALYELTNQKRSPFFDVYDTTRSQVYVGRTIETEKALRAVSRSRGLVLTWQDQPFKCFFHSTCGGQTVDSSLVFPKHDITPLSGRPCKNCQSSSVYRWKNVFSRKQVVGKLAEGLERPIDALERIEVLERSGGRVVKIQVVVDGQAFTLSGPQFRGFIGYDRKALPSTAFEVQLEGERVIFAGRGWGHGVGMCQFGAKGMADRGDAGSDIVRFYYPGADLIKFW